MPRLICGGGLVLVVAFAVGCRYPAIRADQPIPVGGRYHKRIFQDPADQQIQRILLKLASLENQLLANRLERFPPAGDTLQKLSEFKSKSQIARIGGHIVSILSSQTTAHSYEIYLLRGLFQIEYNYGFVDWDTDLALIHILSAKAAAAKTALMKCNRKTEYRIVIAVLLAYSAIQSDDFSFTTNFTLDDRGEWVERELDLFFGQVDEYISR